MKPFRTKIRTKVTKTKKSMWMRQNHYSQQKELSSPKRSGVREMGTWYLLQPQPLPTRPLDCLVRNYIQKTCLFWASAQQVKRKQDLLPYPGANRVRWKELPDNNRSMAQLIRYPVLDVSDKRHKVSKTNLTVQLSMLFSPKGGLVQ